MSERLNRYRNFSALVEEHVENYTVPQYGDYPNDQLSNWSEQDFKTTLQRYANRIGSNARGPVEAMRDCLKMAHYAGELYLLYEQQLQQEGFDIEPDRVGQRLSEYDQASEDPTDEDLTEG